MLNSFADFLMTVLLNIKMAPKLQNTTASLLVGIPFWIAIKEKDTFKLGFRNSAKVCYPNQVRDFKV